MTNATSNYRVIIVGAGFAGVAAARRLGKAKIPTLLIDRNNYSQFQPLLYQVASSQLPPSDVAEPLRAIFRKRPSVRVLTAEVTAIDAAAHTVTVDDGTVYSAQTLVIAAGAVVNFVGTPGAAEHAYPLYSVSDSTRLGAAIIEQFDKADARVAAGEALDATNIVVVGAGPTGVEMAGAIAETINTVVPRTYSDAVREAFTVHLADLSKTVLGPFTEELQQYAQEHLEELGVQLHLGTSVKEVRADGVTLSDGEVLAAPIVIWAGVCTHSRWSGKRASRPAGAADWMSMTTSQFPVSRASTRSGTRPTSLTVPVRRSPAWVRWPSRRGRGPARTSSPTSRAHSVPRSSTTIAASWR